MRVPFRVFMTAGTLSSVTETNGESYTPGLKNYFASSSPIGE